MSRFFGKKDKNKDSQKFYVEFLGWIESKGLRGRKYTDPVVENLRRKQVNWHNPPKFTLQVSNQEIKISQDIEEKKKRKIKTVNYPIIPTRDVTYIAQATHPDTGRPDDIVACIYLGYVPRTNKYVHVHVYRFDTAETAAQYVKLLNSIILVHTDRTKEIERNLASKGHIHDPRLIESDGYSDPRTDSAADSGASTFSENSFPDMDDIEPDLQSLKEVMAYDNVTDELRQRLNVSKKEGVPLLLPPKDYDTISRAKGNLDRVEKRKCLNETIVGVNVQQQRSRNGSDESGIDLSTPSDDSEDKMSEDRDKLHNELDSPISSPPLSARDSYRDVYPPQSARGPGTPRSVHEHRILTRNLSFHSNYSTNSFRSIGSASSNDGSAVIYKGERTSERVDDLPPDYDNEEPVQMRKGGMNWRNTNLNASMPDQRFQRNAFSENLNKSMPSHVLKNEQVYAVVNQKRTLSTNTSQNMYSPRSQVNQVRRVHSMYNYK
ncbi:uncharacterized protein LOC134681053 [Mytilus trossulus]|uniref:uncharacterized protein LOC134681053 n=1 Tax=Mytilus trossulus TaxID=6551 RepID=UPI0030073F18